MAENLTTKAPITWCPGCPNNQILVAFRQAITELANKKQVKIENLVAAAGIGCHGKIAEYLDINTYTSLHGRVLPALTGIKIANPSLTVVGFVGDGDAYAEGIEHLVHSARRNSDVKVFVHDNRVFALTTGQTTPTSPKGFKGKSTPGGSIEEPFDPLTLMLASGASFVAQTYAGDIPKTKEILSAAILHRGFAFVNIIQPCLTFFDTRDFFKDRIVWREKEPQTTIEAVMNEVKSAGEKVPCGIFFQTTRPTFEKQL